jgi:acyl-CoA synthetase (AMP-forming)/AMP-acid ligase II
MTDKNFNFYNFIEQSLKLHAQKKLLLWGKDSFMGADILKEVQNYQRYLEKLQIPENSKVVLAAPASPKSFFMILAIMAQGFTPVIPPPNISKGSFLEILKKINAKCIILEKPTLLKKILFKMLNIQIADISQIESKEEKVPTKQVSGKQSALISYSSGSTGKHKAILRSHEVLFAQHLAIKSIFPPSEDQIDFPLFPNILLHNLIVGVKSVMPAIQKFALAQVNMEVIIEQIIQEKVCSLTGNVFYFSKMVQYLKEKPLKLSSIRALGIGGSPVPEKLLFELKAIFDNAEIYTIYGSSEAEPIAVRKVVERKPPIQGFCVGNISDLLEAKIVPIGELNINGEKIAVGEICVKGNHVALKEGEEWLHTGDFGYQDKHNHLFLTARKGNEALIGGIQHYMIEQVLLCAGGVSQVAAIAKENKFDMYVLTKLRKQAILDLLKQSFDENIIGEIYIKDYLPTDKRHHSKILYQKIK